MNVLKYAFLTGVIFAAAPALAANPCPPGAVSASATAPENNNNAVVASASRPENNNNAVVASANRPENNNNAVTASADCK